MNATPFALVPVGRDCDCGHPMVWYGDEQRCAVYGRHPAPAQQIHFRSTPGPHDELLWALSTLPCLSSRAQRSRRRRARRSTAA